MSAIGDSLQSMRAFLARLDQRGELLSVDAPVETDFEVAACLVALFSVHARTRAVSQGYAVRPEERPSD